MQRFLRTGHVIVESQPLGVQQQRALASFYLTVRGGVPKPGTEYLTDVIVMQICAYEAHTDFWKTKEEER